MRLDKLFWWSYHLWAFPCRVHCGIQFVSKYPPDFKLIRQLTFWAVDDKTQADLRFSVAKSQLPDLVILHDGANSDETTIAIPISLFPNYSSGLAVPGHLSQILRRLVRYYLSGFFARYQ